MFTIQTPSGEVVAERNDIRRAENYAIYAVAGARYPQLEVADATGRVVFAAAERHQYAPASHAPVVDRGVPVVVDPAVPPEGGPV